MGVYKKNNSLYTSSKIKLDPLIYRGLINEIQDIYSIFLLNNGKMSAYLYITYSNKPHYYIFQEIMFQLIQKIINIIMKFFHL